MKKTLLVLLIGLATGSLAQADYLRSVESPASRYSSRVSVLPHRDYRGLEPAIPEHAQRPEQQNSRMAALNSRAVPAEGIPEKSVTPYNSKTSAINTIGRF